MKKKNENTNLKYRRMYKMATKTMKITNYFDGQMN